jgi:hypothetical protein
LQLVAGFGSDNSAIDSGTPVPAAGGSVPVSGPGTTAAPDTAQPPAIPKLYADTADQAEVVDKETYLAATVRIGSEVDSDRLAVATEIRLKAWLAERVAWMDGGYRNEFGECPGSRVNDGRHRSMHAGEHSTG